MTAYIAAVATAPGKRRVTQDYVFDFFNRHFALEPAERDLYRRILLEGPIKTRYMAIDYDEQICASDPDALIERFTIHAKALAVEAAQRAIANAQLAPHDIGGLVVNTCTGYLCPGLSSYVAEALGLGKSVKVFDLMGMGCGAALPNLECGAGLLAALDGKAALCVAVEICSATIFMAPNPDLIVSNCIFGDGAAACVLTSHPRPGALRLAAFETTLLPQYRDHLRYRTEQGRLRNMLSRRVPAIGADAIGQSVNRLLERRGVSQDAIAFWAVHPGGSAVLDRVQRKLRLPEHHLQWSRQILRDYGNLSSPSVLFVLERILTRCPPQSGQNGVLLSFGAGFTAFAVLIEAV